LDRYISDLNKMVRGVWEVTGDSGIEVLPVCLVIFDGIDEIGGGMLAGLQDWIRWIGEEGGRKAVACLAEVGEGGGAEIYKPGFLKLQAKRGDQVGRAMPVRELGRMLAEREGETDEGREGRESFENGVSMEGEFAFTKAVAAYCKEAVREGSFRGNYVLNIKEQMEQRAMRAEREG
jgi:hypothetical protein